MTIRGLKCSAVAVLSLVLLIVSLAPASAAPQKKIAMPDFTQGDAVPEGANHDWNLGATGARGWMFSDRLTTIDARQVYITQVAKGSPAQGVLEVGDVLLGVAGEKFSYDPRTELGQALTKAEQPAGRGNLSLMRWRKGKTETVELKLEVLGNYSSSAPYGCSKSRRILQQGCAALAKQIEDPKYRRNPIERSLNALALLASGEKQYLPLVKKEAQWAAGYAPGGYSSWYYGYVIMFLSEYAMHTGDDSVMPGLKRLALDAANGQSNVGSWGHRFANPDGRLAGYGMMNAPGLTLTTGLVLAREAGVNDPKLDLAIDRSVKLLRFYAGKGSIPYGDHDPWIQTHEDNGKNGVAAVLFNLLGDREAAEYFSRMSVASHGPERDCGHTGNYLNMLWAMPGINPSGPNAAGAWMQEFGGWYYDLARQSDGTFRHPGPPQVRTDSFRNWDATGAYLLAYAMPLKQIRLTGKGRSVVPNLSRREAQSLIHDGRGWSSKDRNSTYDKIGTEVLIENLSSWSPVVRERSAMALGRRKAQVLPQLIALLKGDDLYGQYGACQALKFARGDLAQAVPVLVKMLDSDDLWLRILAAQGLAGVGKPALSAVPVLLDRLASAGAKDDPRKMEQRYLCFALFGQRGGLIGRSIEGVDRDQLFEAVRAGLSNDDGRARGTIGSVYRQLTFEEIKPLLPAIHRAIVEPAPSGIMFASQIRDEGLQVLAKHRVEEGLDACVYYLGHQNPWASEKRTPKILKVLLTYGAHAKAKIPELQAIADDFADGEPNFPRRLSRDKADMVQEAIKQIQASTDLPKLIKMEQ